MDREFDQGPVKEWLRLIIAAFVQPARDFIRGEGSTIREWNEHAETPGKHHNFSVLVALVLYVFMSIIAASGGGFPFLVGALFLLATAIAVVFVGINISLWSHKRARYRSSAIGKIGAWIITTGIVIAVASVITQLFRAGGFWEPLFSELLWVITAATGLLWLGFILLMVSGRTR